MSSVFSISVFVQHLEKLSYTFMFVLNRETRRREAKRMHAILNAVQVEQMCIT